MNYKLKNIFINKLIYNKFKKPKKKFFARRANNKLYTTCIMDWVIYLPQWSHPLNHKNPQPNHNIQPQRGWLNLFISYFISNL